MRNELLNEQRILQPLSFRAKPRNPRDVSRAKVSQGIHASSDAPISRCPDASLRSEVLRKAQIDHIPEPRRAWGQLLRVKEVRIERIVARGRRIDNGAALE